MEDNLSLGCFLFHIGNQFVEIGLVCVVDSREMACLLYAHIVPSLPSLKASASPACWVSPPSCRLFLSFCIYMPSGRLLRIASVFLASIRGYIDWPLWSVCLRHQPTRAGSAQWHLQRSCCLWRESLPVILGVGPLEKPMPRGMSI